MTWWQAVFTAPYAKSGPRSRVTRNVTTTTTTNVNNNMSSSEVNASSTNVVNESSESEEEGLDHGELWAPPR